MSYRLVSLYVWSPDKFTFQDLAQSFTLLVLSGYCTFMRLFAIVLEDSAHHLPFISDTA